MRMSIKGREELFFFFYQLGLRVGEDGTEGESVGPHFVAMCTSLLLQTSSF